MNDTATQRRPRRPEWIVVRAFGVAILVGAALLCLPIASASGRWTHPLDALFTATSATCVTGLIVVDTGAHFSPFGHSVILCLIQMGALGIMTLGTFLLVLIGRRLSVQGEFVLMDSLGHERIRGLKPLLATTILYTILFETVGAALLGRRLFTHHGYTVNQAVRHGIFHSISAFCNAGFSLHADSLIGWRQDPVLMLTVMALIVLGGLGFLVLYNLSSIRFWRRDRLRRGRLSLHTKIVLSSSGLLLLIGWIGFLALEARYSLADMTWLDKMVAALFHSVSPRTAGFNVIDMANVHPPASLLTMLLMFVGGSPSSTAGGIKTTTFVVLVLTVVAMVRGREETELHGRTIPARAVREALSIFLLSLLCVVAFFGVLLLTEHVAAPSPYLSGADALLFETVSAFGTVGLSMGVTPTLSAIGKLCIIICMFIGRLGPMAIALVIGARDLGQSVRYPEEDVVVG